MTKKNGIVTTIAENDCTLITQKNYLVHEINISRFMHLNVLSTQVSMFCSMSKRSP